MLTLDSHAIRSFRNTVYDYYHKHGRHDLPWRKTADPYHILVSEIMLQQTQVPRVISKYIRFVEQFGTIESLAKSSTKDVLEVWQGLGYNRRALMLQKMAVDIVNRFERKVPQTEDDLLTLPGIGPYTASAVMAFAFNKPSIVIDTNIRSVMIHHFFRDRMNVTDREVRPVVISTLDRNHPRTWYSALMDYGVHLKSSGDNPGRKSAHHTRQSPFAGSDRQIRGKILRLLVDNDCMSYEKILETLDEPEQRMRIIISKLVSEGFIDSNKNLLSVKSDQRKPQN